MVSSGGDQTEGLAHARPMFYNWTLDPQLIIQIIQILIKNYVSLKYITFLFALLNSECWKEWNFHQFWIIFFQVVIQKVNFHFPGDLCREQIGVYALGFFSFFSQGSHLQWVTSVTVAVPLTSLSSHCHPKLTAQLSLSFCHFPQLVNSQPWQVFVCCAVLLYLKPQAMRILFLQVFFPYWCWRLNPGTLKNILCLFLFSFLAFFLPFFLPCSFKQGLM